MINIQLSYNLYYQWYSENNISVIGNGFVYDILFKESGLANYFKDCNTEDSFLQKLQQADGHFSVIIQTGKFLLIAVDRIRTFPVFFQQKENSLTVTDKIETIDNWNETEIKNFKKVYCTLENNTLVNNWFQLQAGEYLVIDKTTSSFQIKSYFKHSSNKSLRPDKSLLQNLEARIIEQTIQYANGRTILVPLSGGYDSRYLLCLLKESNYQHIVCFTYGRKESYEAKVAQQVAAQLQIRWYFIEYTDELLSSFFSAQWKKYSDINHHFTSLPHEQDFFALHYLQENELLPADAVIVNGYCQDIHSGSFIEPITNFNLSTFIKDKYQLTPDLATYENNWNGYQEWLVKNRLSKFIINSVRVFEYFGMDFCLPFWNKEWINFWYELQPESRLNQQFYIDYLFDGIFKKHEVDFKKPAFDTANQSYSLKKLAKSVLPDAFVEKIQVRNKRDKKKDSNNTLYLYQFIYEKLLTKPPIEDLNINNIHALYFLEKLKEKYQL